MSAILNDRQQLLQQFGDILVADIKPIAKRFAPSVVSEVSDTGLEIKADKYISTLVDGRRPTSPNAPKGDPTLQEILLDWIRANGIKPAQGGVSEESLSWAMASSMHLYGDRLYQQGGGKDIFAEVLNEQRIQTFTNLLSDGESKIIAQSTINTLTL